MWLRDLGITLTQEQYNGLSNAYRSAENRYRKIDAEILTLDAFLRRFVKGSKPFRNVLASDGVKTKPVLLPQVKTFLRLIDCEPPPDIRIKSLFCGWNKTVFSSRINMFKFKFYNNRLGTNNRISHFNREVDAGCTFCNLAGPRPVPVESFKHIFFDCPIVHGIILEIEKKYLRGNPITMEKFFLANFGENEKR
jgi:hypothetical protein